jgi:hypothetical protein
MHQHHENKIKKEPIADLHPLPEAADKVFLVALGRIADQQDFAIQACVAIHWACKSNSGVIEQGR